jgi:hypothetical protein
MDLLAQYRCVQGCVTGSMWRSGGCYSCSGLGVAGPGAARSLQRAPAAACCTSLARSRSDPLAPNPDHVCVPCSDGAPGSPGDSGGDGKPTLLAKAVSAAPAVDTTGLTLAEDRAVPTASTRMLLRECGGSATDASDAEPCACAASSPGRATQQQAVRAAPSRQRKAASLPAGWLATRAACEIRRGWLRCCSGSSLKSPSVPTPNPSSRKRKGG